MAVLVLAIETSCRRGSVALVESGNVLASAWHDQANAHGERLLGLIDAVFRTAKLSPGDLERVAVGRGPGTFTGLRVGLALAQGIAAGLGIRAVGVGSLRAMAAAVPGEMPGNRWPILDARRGELFVACFGGNGRELISPRAVPRHLLVEQMEGLSLELGGPPVDNWVLGSALTEVPGLMDDLSRSTASFLAYKNDATDWPGAIAVGVLASSFDVDETATPDYLRDADAVIPALPPSPLRLPRTIGP
jgi:tRNA threonylcarbamoyl adenosine modification protein YeaZ